MPESGNSQGWTMDSLVAHLNSLMDNIEKHYDTVLTDQDVRYTERFQAQERAVEVALAVVDREFREHIATAKQELGASLVASEKAVDKAEQATEKRFESVNEFRNQLNELISTFASRKEIESTLNALSDRLLITEKFVATTTGLNESIARSDRRIVELEKNNAQNMGMYVNRDQLAAVIAQIGTLMPRKETENQFTLLSDKFDQGIRLAAATNAAKIEALEKKSDEQVGAIQDRLNAETNRGQRSEGRSEGISKSVAVAIAIISTLIALGSFTLSASRHASTTIVNSPTPMTSTTLK